MTFNYKLLKATTNPTKFTVLAKLEKMISFKIRKDIPENNICFYNEMSSSNVYATALCILNL